MSRFLLPRLNSISRYCSDWNPDERPRVLRNAEYSKGVSVDNTLHAPSSSSCRREMRASILNDGSRLSRRTHSNTWPSSCRNSRIHSSDTWWTMMNNISSCSGEFGCCALSSLSSCRYSPYAFVLEIHAACGFLVVVLHVQLSEKTQCGTRRHPCSSSRSSLRQSAHCA